MKTYCLKCKTNTDNIDPKMFRTKNNRLLMQSICSVCKNKISRFVKVQEAKGLLSNLGIKTPLSKISMLKFMQTENTDFIYKNGLDKAYFQHDMAYGKSKDLVKRTQSVKVLRDKAFKIASDPTYDGYQRGLASMVYKFFDKKSSGSGITNGSNYQLSNELHKLIIEKFKKRKVYSSFRDNIWGVDLADMQSLSRYNKIFKYLLCAIDLFSKYAWVIPIKDKKGTSIVNTFQKITSKGRKPNKIRVDQGSDFYNHSFKDFLKINNIEM